MYACTNAVLFPEKSIRNVGKKDVGMACKTVCKQGRDDINVNIQIPIATSYYTTVCTLVSKRCRAEALYIYLMFISFLPCLYTFWHAIPIFF